MPEAAVISANLIVDDVELPGRRRPVFGSGAETFGPGLFKSSGGLGPQPAIAPRIAKMKKARGFIIRPVNELHPTWRLRFSRSRPSFRPRTSLRAQRHFILTYARDMRSVAGDFPEAATSAIPDKAAWKGTAHPGRGAPPQSAFLRFPAAWPPASQPRPPLRN